MTHTVRSRNVRLFSSSSRPIRGGRTRHRALTFIPTQARGVRTVGLFGRRQQEMAIVEVALPDLARERAEEIVHLSRSYSEEAAGFGSPREVIGPALLYGLAHMHERYSQAVARRA